MGTSDWDSHVKIEKKETNKKKSLLKTTQLRWVCVYNWRPRTYPSGSPGMILSLSILRFFVTKSVMFAGQSQSHLVFLHSTSILVLSALQTCCSSQTLDIFSLRIVCSGGKHLFSADGHGPSLLYHVHNTLGNICSGDQIQWKSTWRHTIMQRHRRTFWASGLTRYNSHFHDNFWALFTKGTISIRTYTLMCSQGRLCLTIKI